MGIFIAVKGDKLHVQPPSVHWAKEFIRHWGGVTCSQCRAAPPAAPKDPSGVKLRGYKIWALPTEVGILWLELGWVQRDQEKMKPNESSKGKQSIFFCSKTIYFDSELDVGHSISPNFNAFVVGCSLWPADIERWPTITVTVGGWAGLKLGCRCGVQC